MARLKPGDKAPDFKLSDQNGNNVALKDYAGRRLFVFFYPKANTSGCTLQARTVRDALPQLAESGVSVLGISPDQPAQQKKFDDKHALGFPLLSDADHGIAAAYDVWGEKKMYGKTFEGIIRSAFLIDEKGKILHAWYKISPKDTVPELMRALALE